MLRSNSIYKISFCFKKKNVTVLKDKLYKTDNNTKNTIYEF